MVTRKSDTGATPAASRTTGSTRRAAEAAASEAQEGARAATDATELNVERMTRGAREMGEQMMRAAGNPFANFSQLMEQFTSQNNPMMGAVMEAQRQGMESWMQANRTAWESMQALARKQNEVWTHSMQRIQQAAATGFSDPNRQAELIREACQKSLNDMRELAEIASKSQASVMADMTKRANQQMKELQTMLKDATNRSS